MRLLLVSHGVTAWNVQGRYQGHTDVPLSPTGRRQAALLRRRLAGEPLDGAYASDLSRARDTAAAIAGDRGLPVEPDARLRELHFGGWEGRTYDEVRQSDPQALAAWEEDPVNVAPPGGEALAQMAERLRTFLADLAGAPNPDEKVLVVAHRGALQVLACLALGLPPQARRRLRLEPASLSELSLHPGGAVLECWNDTHHLREVAHAG
jgi:alpha-ribazole phosphatase